MAKTCQDFTYSLCVQALKSTELSMPSSADQSAGDVELELQIDSLKQQVADLQSEQNKLKEQLRTAEHSSEDQIQAGQEVLQEQHAGQMSVLKTEFECLLEDYTAKDQQVNDLLKLILLCHT